MIKSVSYIFNSRRVQNGIKDGGVAGSGNSRDQESVNQNFYPVTESDIRKDARRDRILLALKTNPKKTPFTNYKWSFRCFEAFSPPMR
jgi:hypothetical protein